MAGRPVVRALLSASEFLAGESAWLRSMIFARMSLKVEPFLDCGMIFAVHSVGESADGFFPELPISSVLSVPDMHVSGFGGVETIVEDGENAGELEADWEAPQRFSCISELPNFSVSRVLVWVPSPQSVVVILARSISTPMATAQLCDGKEDRTGDGGGDQLISGYMTGLCKVNLSFGVEGTPG